jgi:hypothetical protein
MGWKLTDEVKTDERGKPVYTWFGSPANDEEANREEDGSNHHGR